MRTQPRLENRQTLRTISAILALGLTFPFSTISSATDDDHEERRENREPDEHEHERELDKAHQELVRGLERAHERHDRVAIINLDHEMRVLQSEKLRRKTLQRFREEERERRGDREEGIERHVDELHEHMEELHAMLEELKAEIEELRELAEVHEEDLDDDDD